MRSSDLARRETRPWGQTSVDLADEAFGTYRQSISIWHCDVFFASARTVYLPGWTSSQFIPTICRVPNVRVSSQFSVRLNFLCAPSCIGQEPKTHGLVDHEPQLVRNVALVRCHRPIDHVTKAELSPVQQSSDLRDKLGVRKGDLEEGSVVVALISPEGPFELNLGVENRPTGGSADSVLVR